MSAEVGRRVQQVRADAQLNQREFASRLGTSSGGVSQIESGKTMPGGDFLLRIHREFGADVTWLLTGAIGGTIPQAVAEVELLPEGDRTLLANFHAAPAQVQAGVKTALGAFKPAAGGKRRAG